MGAEQIKVLILGGTGMLGNALLRLFASSKNFRVVASVRNADSLSRLPPSLHNHVETGVDVDNVDTVARFIAGHRPDVVVNCIGLVKQLSDANDPLLALPINAMFPHRLARMCASVNARLVHISTDCVFDGAKGNYVETDFSDADDLYGRSKLLGEVDYPNAITLRTSIIGHELGTNHGLVEWFLSQSGSVRGYARAIFSGLPTVEMGRVIRNFVIPRPQLSGLFHVSAGPISKLELLKLIARHYGKDIEIIPDDRVVIDRSLDSARFRNETQYAPPPWDALIEMMKNFG